MNEKRKKGFYIQHINEDCQIEERCNITAADGPDSPATALLRIKQPKQVRFDKNRPPVKYLSWRWR